VGPIETLLSPVRVEAERRLGKNKDARFGMFLGLVVEDHGPRVK
jgi:hypothetical protein